MMELACSGARYVTLLVWSWISPARLLGAMAIAHRYSKPELNLLRRQMPCASFYIFSCRYQRITATAQDFFISMNIHVIYGKAEHVLEKQHPSADLSAGCTIEVGSGQRFEPHKNRCHSRHYPGTIPARTIPQICPHYETEQP